MRIALLKSFPWAATAKKAGKVSTKISIAGSNPRRNAGKRERGFTLMELAVGITLIGLAYLLLPKMGFWGVSGPELKTNVRAFSTGPRIAPHTPLNSRPESLLSIDVQAREFSVP